MPNRYVREAAIKSRAVNALSWQAEVFWRRLLNVVDDFGRYAADPDILRAVVFPRQLERVRETDISRLLAECEKAGLLYRFEAESKWYLVMNQWEQGRAKSSRYPDPPANICKHLQTYVYNGLQMSPAPAPTLTPTPVTPQPPVGEGGTAGGLELSGDGVEGSETAGMKPKGALQLRAERLFRRKPETPLTEKERRAFAKNRAAIKATPEEDWRVLEEFYAAPQAETYARKDLLTMVNNWNGEIDRAKAWKKQPNANTPKTPAAGARHVADRNAGTLNNPGDYDGIASA